MAEGEGGSPPGTDAKALATELKQAYDEAAGSAEAMDKISEKLAKQSLEMLKALEKELGTHERILDTLKERQRALKKQGADAADLAAKAEEYLNKIKASNAFLKKGNVINAAAVELARQKAKAAKNALEVAKAEGKLSAVEFAARETAAAKAEAEYQNEVRRHKQRVSAQNELAGTFEPISSGFNDVIDSMHSLNQGNADMLYKFTNDFANHMKGVAKQVTGGFDFSLSGIISKFFELGLALDKVSVEFARTTRLGSKFNEVLDTTIERSMKFGASMEDVAGANRALATTVTDFTLATADQAQMLSDTTTLMTRFGISAETTATNLQTSMKMFGQSIEGANMTMYELVETAEELKMLPEELAAGFGKMGRSLAKLGSEGTAVFKELARVSKITGMEMEKVISMTDKFDTFEGAAEQVGKINAALGGNFVNAMDLMMETDPTARFQTMRDALLDAGLRFDDMSYYQRKFFAESMGLADVGDLALMMSGNMNSLGEATNLTTEDYERMAAEAETMQSVQDKFNSTMAEFFMENKDEVMDFIDKIRSLLEYVMANVDTWTFWIKTIIKFKLLIMVLTPIMALLRGAIIMTAQAHAAAAAAQAAKTGQDLASIPPTLAQTAAQHGLGTAFMSVASSGWRAAIVIGLIVLALAALVYVMMIASPSKLVLAIFALGAAIFFMGRMSDASIASITALSMPLLTVAAGAALVSLGIAAMAYSFSLMDATEMLAMGASLLAIAFALKILSPALIALGGSAKVAAIGLAIAAAFILAIGGSVALAGLGIKMMGEGMRVMFDVIDLNKIVLFQAFLGTLIGIAGPLIAAGAGFGALGLGLGSFAIGLGMVSADKLQSLAEFAQGIAQVDVGGLDQLAKALELVAEAMDSIPTSKAIALTATMKATAITAKAVEALGGTGAGRGGGGGRGRDGGGDGGLRAGRSQPFEVNFILDGDVFERKVITITRTENERFNASAGRGEE
jgi:hypothetical protein